VYNSAFFLNRIVVLVAILAMVSGGFESRAVKVSGTLDDCSGPDLPLNGCIPVRSIPPGSGPASPSRDSPWGGSNWTISELQPDVPNGGRANTIAVQPNNDSTILVASESGGLFKSTNGGATWKHLDGLAPYFTNSVAFLPKNPKVAIVTTSEDFSVTNRGGIWRSEDEGKTWAPVAWASGGLGGPNATPKLSPSPPGITGYSAFEISIDPETGTSYVASSHGVEVGSVDGKTWTHRNPGAAALPLIAVLALPKEASVTGNTILAGGGAGVWRSADSGLNWTHLSDGPGCATMTEGAFVPGCIMDMHAFGRSAFAKKQAFAVNNDKELYYTADRGLTWSQISKTPKFDAGCGGIAFIQVRPSPKQPGVPLGSIDLYFGDRCDVFRLTAPPILGTDTYDYSKNTWKTLSSDHGDKVHPGGDTRHIAFNSSNAPVLLATDGGLHKTGDGGTTWTYTGGGANGYNALQIYQVKGQWVTNIGRHNLYFGTQDNGFFSSADVGKTWVKCPTCNEGDFFEAEPRVATPAESQVTFWAKSVNTLMSGISLADPLSDWPDPPDQVPSGQPNAAWIGHPKIVAKNFHVQWVNDASTNTISGGLVVPKQIRWKGLAVTYSLGKSPAPGQDAWPQYAVINDTTLCGNCSRLDLPRASYPPNGEPVLYQALGRDGAGHLEHGALARLVPKPNANDATTQYPAMTNFGGFGIAPTMEGWFRVFAVDPTDPNHLLAPDVFGGKMMESTDGGSTWTDMPQLTALVTQGGKLNFTGRIFFSQLPPLWAMNFAPITQVSAISFSPDNPALVAVGTVQSGVFVSNKGGKTWTKVPLSERATLISSLYWRKDDEIIVSTYGRGLWRVKYKFVGPVIPCARPDCFHIYYQRPPGQPPSPYDQVIVAYGGEIRGVRLRGRILQEIFVQPGTTLAYGVASQAVPDILVTETTASAQSLGAVALPRAPAGAPVISGLTLRSVRSQSQLVGVMFSRRPLSMFVPPAAAATVVRPTLPARPWSGPTFELQSGPEVVAGDSIRIKGGGLPARTEVEIQLDEITVRKVVSDEKGNIAASLEAPGFFGFHSLTMAVRGKAINGAILSIRPRG
jgi:photosystem II stability/assembly factor-like uncharacterized protein